MGLAALRARGLRVVLTALALLGCRHAERRAGLGARRIETAPPLTAVRPDGLCATAGRLEPTSTGFRVTSAGMRALTTRGPHLGGEEAELRFTYDGPSPETEPLANGELRRQIGLKLRAANTCNVVYVMWHLGPTRGIHVSVKRNPGQSWHFACRDRGYVNVRPDRTRDVASTPGEPHTLRALLRGPFLEVYADGVSAWQGRLPDAAFEFDGPVGVRSDNGRFSFELRVPGGDSSPSCH